MFPRMIRGWFTARPSWRGRGGTHIPESGLAARTSRSEWDSESASTVAMDGAGLIGDSIGTTTLCFITTIPTTPRARRFISRTVTTEVEARAAEFTTIPALPPNHSTETPKQHADTLRLTAKAASNPARSAATTTADRPRAIRHVEAPA